MTEEEETATAANVASEGEGSMSVISPFGDALPERELPPSPLALPPPSSSSTSSPQVELPSNDFFPDLNRDFPIDDDNQNNNNNNNMKEEEVVIVEDDRHDHEAAASQVNVIDSEEDGDSSSDDGEDLLGDVHAVVDSEETLEPPRSKHELAVRSSSVQPLGSCSHLLPFHYSLISGSAASREAAIVRR